MDDNKKEEPKKEEENDTHLFLGEDEEFFIEDEELSKVLKEELKEEKTPKEAEPIAQKEAIPQEIEKVKPEELPVLVKIEIASITLPAKKVLELQPGNEITLDKEVDNSVKLLVNGKYIGTGELIQIGDVLGVRILSL